jgi:hypothetical protein
MACSTTVLPLIVVALVVAACGSTAAPPAATTETKTVTATAPTDGPRSELIDVTLPAGSIPNRNIPGVDVESNDAVPIHRGVHAKAAAGWERLLRFALVPTEHV